MLPTPRMNGSLLDLNVQFSMHEFWRDKFHLLSLVRYCCAVYICMYKNN